MSKRRKEIRTVRFANTFPHDRIRPTELVDQTMDMLADRLDEVSSLLNALLNTYDHQADEFYMPAPYMLRAISGISTLLDGARDAAEVEVFKSVRAPKTGLTKET
jgi:hypothetical protein